MNWQIGDLVICITPGSKLENRQVMVISRPLVDLSKADVVYCVHPGFPDGENWGWGAERRHLRPLPNPNGRRVPLTVEPRPIALLFKQRPRPHSRCRPHRPERRPMTNAAASH